MVNTSSGRVAPRTISVHPDSPPGFPLNQPGVPFAKAFFTVLREILNRRAIAWIAMPSATGGRTVLGRSAHSAADPDMAGAGEPAEDDVVVAA